MECTVSASEATGGIGPHGSLPFQPTGMPSWSKYISVCVLSDDASHDRCNPSRAYPSLELCKEITSRSGTFAGGQYTLNALHCEV